MQMTRLLKLVLTADALSCLAMGAALLAGSVPLASLFGLSAGLLWAAGLVLLPIGLFILVVALRRTVRPVSVHAIIAGNVLWVAASLLLAIDAGEATAIGTAFVLVQAAAVAVLTVLEFLSAARAPRAVAATA